ncbi:MAG: stage V sporulation protein B [Clostridium sp.]|uniref:stage V sporulation protein B n=1 Tax=Clostridium sp. TaxID=1506 RepID=UPI00305C9AAD
MKKDTFYRDTLVLTLSNLAMGVLRFMFSIILSRQLGPEGVGLYGLIMPIYDLFCCLVCGGIIAAISKETSACIGTERYEDLHKTVNASLVFIILWSIFISGIMFILTPIICNYIIKDPRAIKSLWIGSPAIIFIAISCVYKGYFYGISEVITPSVIDILEKAVRMILLVSIIYYFSLITIENTVAATYFSFTVGEIISFLFLYIFYKRSKKKIPYTNSTRPENSAQLLFNILIVALPLAINGFLTTALQSIATLLVPRRLVSAGFSYIGSLELIGKFNGMALAIVYFPLVIVMSLSTVIIPDISRKISQNDFTNIESRVNEVIKICFMLGISTIIVCFTCPDLLGKLFFNRNDLSELIKLASISAPFMYCHFCTYSILNGIGKQKVILVGSIITALIELVLLFILIGIPSINIYGFGISLIITSIIGLLINLYYINKVITLTFQFGEFIIIALVSTLIFIISTVLNSTIPITFMIEKSISIIAVSFSLFFISITLIRKSS